MLYWEPMVGGAAGRLAVEGRMRSDEMAAQKRGLGRGLGALIPAAPGPGVPGSREPGDAARAGSAALAPGQHQVDGAYFDEIAIGAITPNPRQPRQHFDEDALEELASSI